MNIPMQISLVSEKTEQAIKFIFSKSYSIIPISLLIILIISGCGESTEPSRDNFIMPLKVGNSWFYKNISYEANSSDSMASSYRISILYDIVYNNERCYKPAIYLDEIIVAPIFYVNRNDGLYIFSIENDNYELELKYPTFLGDSFIYNEDTIKVEGVDVEYSVPAGTFKCIKYVLDYWWDKEIHVRSINYVSPGIGQIASESYSNYNQDTLWLESKSILLSYELK